MEKKFTCGPWNVYFPSEATFPGIDKTDGLEIVIWGEKDDESGIRGRNHAERIANAKLIASAPELLEALEGLVLAITNLAHVETTITKETIPEARTKVLKAKISAQHVINKAYGND